MDVMVYKAVKDAAVNDRLVMLASEPTKLTIPTYDGSGQCVHPSVVYCSTPVGGYRWWM